MNHSVKIAVQEGTGKPTNQMSTQIDKSECLLHLKYVAAKSDIRQVKKPNHAHAQQEALAQCAILWPFPACHKSKVRWQTFILKLCGVLQQAISMQQKRECFCHWCIFVTGAGCSREESPIVDDLACVPAQQSCHLV